TERELFALLREECRHNVKSPAFCVVHLKCSLIYITLIPSPLPPPHQPFQISLEICVKGGENICTKSEGARQGAPTTKRRPDVVSKQFSNTQDSPHPLPRAFCNIAAHIHLPINPRHSYSFPITILPPFIT
uniref:Uncharacterized protein n=1 Tax=Myotis lucifugus TaxID=59463 RepID=G1PYM5_MYOLU